MKSLRILICPLDWGLGHATRCIPIINELISLGATPILAADHAPLALLRKEFPDLEWIKFPGIKINYADENQNMVFHMLKQIPNILYGVHKEIKFIEKRIAEIKPDGIISDNRFGAYSSLIQSVYITHQLNIQTNNRFTDIVARLLHQYFMKRYSEVWVPDFEGVENLSGILSHGKPLISTTKYIGPLCRFDILQEQEKVYDAAMILSGPEPQRTLLEKAFIEQAARITDKKFILIRGTENSLEILPQHIKSISLADQKQIAEVYSLSKCIICRSGYSTLMDLWTLNKKAVLIPTPGQTEQEYLADYFKNKWNFLNVEQNTFNLLEVMNSNTSYPQEKWVNTLPSKSVIGEWLNTIQKDSF